MAINTPTQVRTIDPFSEFNSLDISKLTKMASGGADRDVIITTSDLLVTLEDATTCEVQIGLAIKDNVLIDITAPLAVNFKNIAFYAVPSGSTMDENGYYYIAIDYSYVKSRPAPEANIVIIRPSEYAGLIATGRYLVLKAIEVTAGGIVNIYDEYVTTGFARQYSIFYTDLSTLESDIIGIQGTLSSYDGAVTTILTSDLAANMVLISNASGKVATDTSVSSTELNYLNDTTANLQTQINNRQIKYTFIDSSAAGTTAAAWNFINANATAAPFAITIPAANTFTGCQIAIKKTDATANAVTLTGTIDGVVNPTLNIQGDSIILISDGTLIWAF
jgi:hypothetical protein